MTASQWYFGGFRLDPDHACLWRGEQALALTPKVFAVLHYLVTHPDRLVSKEELLDAVWPDVAVTEAVLRVTIGMVRKILDDQAQSPHFIATMPRRGYRFLASVTEAPASAPTTPRHPTILPMPAAGLSEAPTPALNGFAASPHAGVSPVSGALEPLEAERRPLTVLCCTLVDASRLASHVDPEDWRDVMRAYHETCATVIQRFDGYVAQYLDDSVLGYFGYPMAHEDDAQRGVWTGLGLLEALASRFAQLPFPAGEHVAVRLGVHTGLVVIGAVGMDARQEPFALGETFHITKQLQALAAPNTLVISAATYQRITGYFTCEVLGEPLLQELEQPLQAYCVLRPSGIQSRLEVASASGLSPLVGRTAEVEILWERWARVKAGMGQVAVLTGEAGIGKSRLVRVVQDHVAHEAHLFWECRGVSYYQHTALYPLTECLQRWLQWRPGTAPAAALVQLEALLTQAQLVLEEAVPLLADLLALPLPAERYAPLVSL